MFFSYQAPVNVNRSKQTISQYDFGHFNPANLNFDYYLIEQGVF